MVSCPLLTPLTFLLSRDALRLRGETGVRGLGSGRRTDFGLLLCPEFTLREAPRMTVRGHPVQGANAVAAKSSASIKGCALEHQTPLWVPRILTRDRRESRPKERSGSQEGQGNLGVPAPFVSAGRPRHPRPPKAATAHALRGRTVASTGCAAVSAQGLPSADGKKTARPPERRQVSPLCRGENLFVFPLDRFVLLYYYHSTT